MGLTSNRDKTIKIRKGLPIIERGLTFYPITMSDYELFQDCKQSLLIRQSTLPVKYIAKDYLNALFSLEMDSFKQMGGGTGLFQRLMTLLSLSLRIDFDIKKWIEENNFVLKQVGDDLEISHLRLNQGGRVVELTPQEFSTKILPLIAEQNGLSLPDQSENPDLVKDQQALAEHNESGKTKLNCSIESLISSVAYNSKCSEREINDWTVREFENRQKAIERDKKYTLYGQAELSGMVSFKNGNPYPSWKYDSIDDTLGTVSINTLGSKINGIQEKQN